MTRFSYNKDLDAMVVTVEGEVVLGDYRKALEALVQDKHFHPNMDTIWDMRKTSMKSLTTGNVREMVAASIHSAKLRGTHWKTALVVEGNLEFGLARMFEMLGNDTPYQMDIFRTMEEAEAWIKEKEETA